MIRGRPKRVEILVFSNAESWIRHSRTRPSRHKPMKVVGPVRSRFGFHLIKVTEIKGGDIPEFEEQREIVLEAYRRSEGERLFYDYAERLGDLSYENPDSLEPAASALGLEIKASDWMDRNGGTGVLGIPKVVAAAFTEDVLIKGNNSEAVEVGPQHVIVLRTLDHRKADVKQLEDVRAEIVDLLRNEHAADRASRKRRSLVGTSSRRCNPRADCRRNRP